MQAHYGLVQTAAPASEPVTLAEAKLWARIDSTVDDALVTSLIAAARQYAEDYTSRAIITQSWRMTLDRFPGFSTLGYRHGYGVGPYSGGFWGQCGGSWHSFFDAIRLPKPSLISVDQIQYVDVNGTTDTLDPSIYQADTDSEPGRIRAAYGQVWPTTRFEQLGAVKITYTCGYGLPAAVPEQLKTAIKMLIATWYDPARTSITGRNQSEVPFALRSILDNFWTGSFFIGAEQGAY
jgi:hypothetical protein